MSIFVKYNDLDINLWNDFISSHPESNIFHTPEMFEVFRETHNYDPQIWYATDKNQKILAIFPFTHVFLDTKFGKLTGRSISYGGFLAQPNDLGKNALLLIFKHISNIKKYPTVFSEIRNCFDTSFRKIILKGVCVVT